MKRHDRRSALFTEQPRHWVSAVGGVCINSQFGFIFDNKLIPVNADRNVECTAGASPAIIAMAVPGGPGLAIVTDFNCAAQAASGHFVHCCSFLLEVENHPGFSILHKARNMFTCHAVTYREEFKLRCATNVP
jgi:hypothetical protein